MQCKPLLDMIDELSETYLSVWEDVCNLESPTASKAGVDAVGRYFDALAREKGWKIEKLPLETAGDPICITMNPDAPAAPVTFSGHIDTVHPVGLFGTPAVRRDGEKIYGPGVADCKGGAVASFLAMDALERCGFTARPVQLILQTDEETGSRNSGKKTVEFMCEKAKDSVAFFNTEPCSKDKATLSRKGIWRAKLNITGKAAHSSDCMNGASAIAEAAHKLLKLEQMKDKSGLTCNCGVIEGGTMANSVAASCSFLADIRFATEEQYQQAVATVNEVAQTVHIPGCSCRVEQISYRPPMPLEQRNINLLARMNEIYEAAGLPFLTANIGVGGSDAAYTTLAGIPTIDSIGVFGNEIHSVLEFAWNRSLAEAAKRLAVAAYFL